MKPGRFTTSSTSCSPLHLLLQPVKMAPSRRERMRARVNMHQLGDWSTQAENPRDLQRALGADTVTLMAAMGDGAAQYSAGAVLIYKSELEREASLGGVALADVGLALAPHTARSLTGLIRVDVIA